jgi:hypothetical protein
MNDTADESRMLNGQPERGAAAERVADHINLAEAERAHDDSEVVPDVDRG